MRCSSLKEIVIPNSVTTIEYGVFQYCQNLKSVTIPESVSNLEDGIFYGCSLDTLKLYTQTVLIGSSIPVQHLFLGNQYTMIPSNAFNAYTIGTLHLSSSTPPVLEKNPGVKSLEVPYGRINAYLQSEIWNLIDTIYAVHDGARYYPIASVDSQIKVLNALGEEITEVREGDTFRVQLPEGVDMDNSIVLYGGKDITTSLTETARHLPHTQSVVTLFDYSQNALDVTVTEAGNLINQLDLSKVSEIQSLILHGDINGMDIRIINKMNSLAILDLSDVKIVSGGGAYFEELTTEDNVIGNKMFQSCGNLVRITLPNTTTQINDYAFYKMRELKEVRMPNTVTSIGSYAFYGCESLSGITLPNQLELLGASVFYSCHSLRSVILPEGLKSINNNTFYYCKLQSLTIPKSVTSIGTGVFYGCALGEVIITDLSAWCNVSISNSFHSNPFRYATKVICNGKEVGELVIPNDVVTIRDRVFLNCTTLTSIRINDNVKSIGASTFDGCSNVTDIYVYSMEPPTIQSTTFNYELTLTATLHVPKGFKNNFWLADYWGQFTTIVDDLDIKCQLVYKVDGQEYKSGRVACGANIEAIAAPEKEGHTFAGWFQENGDTIPSIMPAHDITVKAKYITNSYKLTYTINDSRITGDVRYSTKITPTFIYEQPLMTTPTFIYEQPLITDVAQFSSPMSDSKQGNFYSLLGKLDECPADQNPSDDFWHSDWHNGTPSLGSHYFQVEMPDGYDKDCDLLFFQFTRRETIDDHTTKWSVRGTNNPNANKVECDELLFAYTPYMDNTETINSQPFAHKGYKYLRFYSEEQQGEKHWNRGFFHISRFQIYPVVPSNLTKKEGHTFEGWFQENGDTIPDIMPAHDVTVYAKYTLNTYRLTYVVDDEVYMVDSVDYATKLEAEPIPEKEGYTFCGWSEMPDSMPAHDVTVTGKFAINSYKLSYLVDGAEYKSFDIKYGSTIIAEDELEKEGYTFSGWSEIPETMPARDVTITGSFTVNKYLMVYLVDEEVYKTDSIAYGSKLTAEVVPEKEGYSFSGWSEIPDSMPARDVSVTGSFTINSYKLTYLLNGEVYKSDSIVYATPLTAEPAIEQEGYTFSGWSEIPTTMPAKDVTVTATLKVNTYTITYIVDGYEYKAMRVDYGTALTAEAAPEKEGYSFSGWSEIPETMPAKDVTITGTFTINSYKLTYEVDGEEYKAYTIRYASTIIPISEPTKEGHTFSGWSEIPEEMPAHDVMITGSFTVNKYKIRYYVGEQLWAEDEVEYGTKLTLRDYTPADANRYSFAGWDGEQFETMPAYDIEYHAMIVDGLSGLNADANGIEAIYDGTGRKLSKMQRGVNVLRMKDGTTRKVFR